MDTLKRCARALEISIAFSFLVIGVLAQAEAPLSSEIEAKLERFHRNPSREMSALPSKRTVAGPEGEGARELFGHKALRNKEFVSAKTKLREAGILKSAKDFSMSSGFAPRASGQRLLELEPAFKTLTQIEAAGLLKNRMRNGLWSGYSWPLYRGGIGQRYADPGFPRSKDWLENFNFVSLTDFLFEQNTRVLSPAEKYDLLLGDPLKSLTTAMWRRGEYFHRRDGRVERWFGFCHGWSVASLTMARPTRAIKVRSRHGQLVTFYPSDVKALMGVLWAEGELPVAFAGGRCNVKDPERDELGRVIEPRCQDVNPGEWHLTLINRLAQQRSFVFDATFDYEVWNHPVLGYEYTYFNPQTKKATAGLVDATVPVLAFTADKFKRYRSPHAVSVVGIGMTLTYLRGTYPRERRLESEKHDSVKSVAYVYDLELDERGNIIGGEWYSSRHPDFLWAAQPGAEPIGEGDALATEAWTDHEPPASWAAASAVSAKKLQPLSKVIQELTRRSQVE